MNDPSVIFGGLFGLVLLVLAVALSIYWLLFPWFVYNKLNKVIEHLAKIEKGIMVMPAATAAATIAPATKSSIPTLPQAARYYVANGEEVTGPFSEVQIRELRKKGAINQETQLNLEGSQEWKPVDDLIKF